MQFGFMRVCFILRQLQEKLVFADLEKGFN